MISSGAGELAGRARDVLRRQVGGQLAVLPFAGRAVRLQAHVRDGVDAVVALDDGGRLLEQPGDFLFLEFFFVLVVAGLVFELHLAAALGGPLGGLGGGQVLFVDEHVEQLVVDLDRGQSPSATAPSVSPATQAIRSPCQRISSPGFFIVRTATTPGTFSAALVSIDLILQWACGQPSTRARSILGGLMS